jgi:small subunit ribosomal protein S20
LPNTKSAEKQVRVTERKRLKNKAITSLCKTNITKAERLIFAGELKEAEAAVVVAVASLDKAAEKGVIHPNNAARRKSRLMKKLNEAKASASA